MANVKKGTPDKKGAGDDDDDDDDDDKKAYASVSVHAPRWWGVRMTAS